MTDTRMPADLVTAPAIPARAMVDVCPERPPPSLSADHSCDDLVRQHPKAPSGPGANGITGTARARTRQAATRKLSPTNRRAILHP